MSFALSKLSKLITSLIFISLISLSINDMNIHVIPHSHMDPGWLKTFLEYYTQDVEAIYDNVYEQMLRDPKRTFVYVEMVNFRKWYNPLEEEKKENIKQWVREGRIEFCGAGLVMNDEAAAYYQDILDQMRFGNQFVKKEFDVKPTTGWMLDPFGHSKTNAFVHSALNFTDLVIERIDYQETESRINDKRLEFIWKPISENQKSIFTHILPLHYGNSFYFNFLSDESYFDNSTENARRKSEELIHILDRTHKGFKHDEILFLLGDDFKFKRGDYLYKKIEFLMNYMNKNIIEGHKIKIFYSTPNKYFTTVRELYEREHLSYHVETDLDFFVYADRQYAYWSGYFTSRPYLKGTSRRISNLYLVSNQFYLDMLLADSHIKISDLAKLEEAIGLLQHHDGVTGTAKDYVSNDYIDIAFKAERDTVEKVIEELKEKSIPIADDVTKICLSNPVVEFGCNNEFNVEEVGGELIVGIYNPEINGDTLITIELKDSGNSYQVIKKDTDIEIPSDFYCIKNDDFKYDNKCFLQFFFNFNGRKMITSFKLIKSEIEPPQFEKLPETAQELISHKSKIESLIYDPLSQSFKLDLNENGIKTYKFSIYNGYYEGFSGGSSPIRPYDSNSDGAYIFAPIYAENKKFEIDKQKSSYHIGKIGVTMIIRNERSTYLIYNFFYKPSFLKLDTIIDPINKSNNKIFVLGLNSDLDNEITVQYNKTSNITENPPPGEHFNLTQTEYWTDSNGIEMMRRVKNYKHHYNHIYNEKVANNFYPITAALSIREKKEKYYTENKYDYLTDDDRMITIFTDRPQAGASMKKGDMQIIIQKSSMNDDGRGVGERIYETASMPKYFKVSHMVMFGHSIYSNNKVVSAYDFFYNYMHKTPFMFRAKADIEDLYSYVNSAVFVSDGIVKNFQIIDSNTIIVQFYYHSDKFFNVKNNNVGLISVRLNKAYKVQMKADYNGVESMDLQKFAKTGFLQTISNNEFDFPIKKNDFIFLTIRFN